MDNNSYSLETKLFCQNLFTHPNVKGLLQLPFLSIEFKECLKAFENFECNITAVHNFFNKLEKNTFLHYLIKRLLSLTKQNFVLDSFLDEIMNEVQQTEYSKEETTLTFIILLYFYLQEAIYGPSPLFIFETEKVDFVNDLEKFYSHHFFKIQSFSDIPNVKTQLLNYLTISGESPYENSNLIFFYIISYHFFVKSSYNFDFFPIINLWRFRLLYLHTNLLPNLVMSIKESIFDNFNKFEENLPKIFNDNLETVHSLYLAEKSHIYLTFYKHSESDQTLEKIKNLLKLRIELTGRLGRKTKFQTFDTPVLVLETESSTINNKKDPLERVLSEDTSKPAFIELDEENPLLEKPKITDDNFLTSTDLSLFDQIYVEGVVDMLKRSFADEELLREIILTYTRKSLEKSNDWLVYSKTLLHKCRAEDKKTKTIERSLGQIKSLCDQYNDRSPNPYSRLHNLFVIDYPYIWKLKKYYAEMFMQYGAVSTAFEIYKELNMMEDCINCLYLAGKKQQAQDFGFELLKKSENPGVYCVLGEILDREEYFHKALEVSNNKYIRAYRCLGKYCFYKNRVEEAITFYEKALEINPIFPNIWFTLGCAYLKMKNWEGAIKSFSSSIQIDDSSGESWANLASSFSQVKKNKEALKCLEEGFKKSRSNWKICENLIFLSIDCQDLNKLFFAISNMISLDKFDRLKPAIFYQMINLFVQKYNSLDSKMKESYIRRIYGVFDAFTIKDGVNVEIWDLYSGFIETVEFKLRKGQLSEEDVTKGYKKILEIRLKQCRNLMLLPEWEKSEKVIKLMENILKVMKEEVLKVTKDGDYKKEIETFVKGNEEKIEKFYKLQKIEREILGKK